MFEALYSLLWIYLFLMAIRHLPFFKDLPGLPQKTLILFFLIKAMAGAAFILIYTYYYEQRTADVFRYFNEGKVIFSALKQNPIDYLRMITGIGADAPHLQAYYVKMRYWWDPELYPVYNDNRLIIRYNAILNLVSFGKIHVNSIIANFISMAGLTALYKFALNYIEKEKITWIKYGIFLFPSLVFWGSGLIKEIMLISLLGFFLYLGDMILRGIRLKPLHYIVFLFFTILLFLLKSYVILLLLPCITAFYLSGKLKKTAPSVVFALVVLFAALGVFAIGWIFPELNPAAVIAKRQNFYMGFSVFVNAGSLIHEVYLEPTLTGVLSYIPRALANVLLRPHIFDSLNPVILMAAIENLAILLMIGFIAFWVIKKKKIGRLAWMGLWFTLMLFIFIGLTTQVYGTLVRFKIPAIPFVWFSFISIVPVEKLNLQIIIKQVFRKYGIQK